MLLKMILFKMIVDMLKAKKVKLSCPVGTEVNMNN